MCFIDDFTHYAISLTAHTRITTPAVVTAFAATCDLHARPASTLTDNGMVFTTEVPGFSLRSCRWGRRSGCGVGSRPRGAASLETERLRDAMYQRAPAHLSPGVRPPGWKSVRPVTSKEPPMASTSKFLAALLSAGVHLNPAIYDAIFPMGPVRIVDVIKGGPAASGALRGVGFGGLKDPRQLVELVAVNPQPLPPHELGIGAALLVEIVRGSIAAAGERGAEGTAKSIAYELDDWCGTGWPGKWPKPRPKLDPRLVFLGGALASADLASRYGGVIADVLSAGVDQLADAALQVGR